MSGKGQEGSTNAAIRSGFCGGRAVYRGEQPADWLFPGQREGRHLTERSAQKVFEKALAEAGIRKQVSIPFAKAFLCDPLAGEWD
ncbi:hypothetical protein [Paenibacillus sp. Mc5Re-14]|uniref:hypothetical protein n=1 Tax=Paenibacillus sp. Mc5Re-14 TaxID=1030529 RepID=UPI000AC2BF38|nr:hypothetical protein [Paenibacillus sp. Mc5Re-14]